MRRLVGLLLLGAALAACGGDDGGSGIDPDKAFTELSDDELVSLCEYVDATLDPEVAVEALCVTQGINAAEEDPAADCQRIIDDCLAAANPTPIDCSRAATEPPPDCPELTVGEYQVCMDAWSEALADTASLTCESSASDLPLFPEACAATIEACPELFGRDSTRQNSAALTSAFAPWGD